MLNTCTSVFISKKASVNLMADDLLIVTQYIINAFVIA